jgi:two-component system phosphate regulon sensor histidine kinase PhoR
MSPTKRIAIILIVVFLIPALFFSVYEISSLSKDEKMIANIYQKQLEAILFSVNQISDATVNGWMMKSAVSQTEKNWGKEESTLTKLLTLNSSIQLTFIVDTIHQKPSITFYSLDSTRSSNLQLLVETSLKENTKQINQLLKYRKSGFQKIESITSANTNFQNLIFVMEGENLPWVVAGFTIDSELFIEEVVGPQLNKISKEQFVLSVFNKHNNTRVYATDERDTTSIQNASLTKDLWVFPNYTLAIKPKGASLQELVRQRTTTNLYLLVGLDVVLIVALVLAFRSVRKEVQLAQNKADFVANVSHEIRTPLALISMFAETLEMGRVPSDEKKYEYYTIIHKETQRLTGIVNKILNFSQTESGKKKLRVQSVVLNDAIKEVLNTYDFHLKSKGFEYVFLEEQETIVLADKEAITEIVINLIDNAMKYSIDKKRIEIALKQKGNFGSIVVRDYGVGIGSADQKHIFDKFYRVSSGDLAKSRGTGLGLSLVKQLLEQQNGNISVQSELGKGSVFTVNLPLAKK